MLFEYKGEKYPEYIKHGNACQFIAPTALKFCTGKGLDVGAGEWPLPGATAVDLSYNCDAMYLPGSDWDYIFSSHCLEHLPDYVGALAHWFDKLRPGGLVFLYLPHPDMRYWRPENNRKHLHVFHPEDVAQALVDLGYENVISGQRDLAWSFAVVAWKPS